MAFSTQQLVFYPFLVIVAAGALWFLFRGFKRLAGYLEASRVERLAREDKLDQAVSYLQSRGKTEKAAGLLVEKGNPARAVDLLVDAGRYIEGAKTALDSGQTLRAGELFQRGGDLASAGGCYLSAGQLDEAVRLLRKVSEIPVAARFLERKGKFEPALRLYMETRNFDRTASIALDSITDRMILKKVGDFLAQHDEVELAFAVYKKGKFFREVGRTAVALGRVEQAIEAYLQHDYFEEAAALYAQTGRHREAAENFIKGGKVAKAVDQLLLAEEYLAVARLFRRTGQPARALETLKSVSIDSTQYRDGMLMACSILVEHQRFKEAGEALLSLLEAIGYSTGNIEVVYRLVDIQIQLGEKDAAIASLETAKRAGVSDPGIDEQLMGLRQSGEELFAPDEESAYTQPAHRKSRVRGATTTIGFPRSDRYALKRKLARGGHGILFLVEDQKLGREAVLKLLHSESIPSDLARRYFMREARTAASLNHPNIVQVFDYGDIEGKPYLVMEFVDGLNLMELHDSLKDELPIDRKLSICIQLCDALAYAHGKSIIHRDIKMENIMVNAYWHVKLMDFGLAKALNENPDRSLFIIGTPFYMSPEQIVGDVLDHRTDIYSVGVLMFRLFTDRLPFEEGEVLSHHRFTPPPDPREFKPELQETLADTILRCLEKDRDERFDSAGEIADILKAIHGGRSV